MHFPELSKCQSLSNVFNTQELVALHKLKGESSAFCFPAVLFTIFSTALFTINIAFSDKAKTL